ncbi:methyl-accepting chemotaxis protein [Brevibacillus reuszeri]|uniref:methyl-accepting chemotaxis protein n=1 Tax=Brevibacillus reuszeri TaxID=54915 RepID=UPI00289BB161|nr:methyl-accepting chemotaxis protein [Brevibacillus reuszeri]
MSIAKRIFLTFAIILAMFAAVGSYLYLESVTQLETTTAMESKILKSALLSEEMKLSVIQVQQWLTDMSATRGLNGLNDGMDKANEFAEFFRQQLQEMKQLNPEDEGLLQEMEHAFEAYYTIGKTMTQAYVEGGPEAGNQFMGDFDLRAEEINQDMDAFRKEKMEQITASVSNIQDSITLSNRLLIIFFICVLAVSGTIAIWLGKSINRPLRKLNQSAMLISHGKLDQPITAESNDELGQLAKAFEQMRANLHVLILGVKNTADEVAAAAEQLSAGAEQTAASSRLIADSVNEIAEGAQKQQHGSERSTISMAEMNAGIEMIAGSSSFVATHSLTMAKLAQQGDETVGMVAKQMDQIHDQSREATEVVHQLDTRTAQIEEILQAMDSITAQTQILALNAAIEAARAGEQGRGFSIVADEVRKLAGESQVSSARIASLVEEIRASMTMVVDAMMKSNQETASGMEIVREANTIFAGIRTTVDEVTDQIQEVSASAEQMTSNSNQVNEAVTVMKQVADRTLSHVKKTVDSVQTQLLSCEEVASSAGRLNREAHRLQELVSKFEV